MQKDLAARWRIKSWYVCRFNMIQPCIPKASSKLSSLIIWLFFVRAVSAMISYVRCFNPESKYQRSSFDTSLTEACDCDDTIEFTVFWLDALLNWFVYVCLCVCVFDFLGGGCWDATLGFRYITDIIVADRLLVLVVNEQHQQPGQVRCARHSIGHCRGPYDSCSFRRRGGGKWWEVGHRRHSKPSISNREPTMLWAGRCPWNWVQHLLSDCLAGQRLLISRAALSMEWNGSGSLKTLENP